MNGGADYHHYLSLLFLPLCVEALKIPLEALDNLGQGDAAHGRLGFLWFHLNAAAFVWLLPALNLNLNLNSNFKFKLDRVNCARLRRPYGGLGGSV